MKNSRTTGFFQRNAFGSSRVTYHEMSAIGTSTRKHSIIEFQLQRNTFQQHKANELPLLNTSMTSAETPLCDDRTLKYGCLPNMLHIKHGNHRYKSRSESM